MCARPLVRERFAAWMRSLCLFVTDWAMDAADWWDAHGKRLRQLRNNKPPKG